MTAMSKKVEQSVVVQPQTEATKVEPKLTMKVGLKYRGARQAWYERMLTLEGKDKAEVTKDVTDKPPSLYGAKSKHAGTPEPVSGWIRFFERTGVATWK